MEPATHVTLPNSQEQDGARLHTRDIPAFLQLDEASPRGVVVVIARGTDAPVFYYHRSAGTVSYTSKVHLAAAFCDYRLAKIFAEFWVRCDSTLGPAYLVKRLT
jgi:hypothetical protein